MKLKFLGDIHAFGAGTFLTGDALVTTDGSTQDLLKALIGLIVAILSKVIYGYIDRLFAKKEKKNEQ